MLILYAVAMSADRHGVGVAVTSTYVAAHNIHEGQGLAMESCIKLFPQPAYFDHRVSLAEITDDFLGRVGFTRKP